MINVFYVINEIEYVIDLENEKLKCIYDVYGKASDEFKNQKKVINALRKDLMKVYDLLDSVDSYVEKYLLS